MKRHNGIDLHSLRPLTGEDPERRRYVVTRSCSKQGCGNSTKDGKPFCLEHLADMPYAGQVIKRVAEARPEDQPLGQRPPRNSPSLGAVPKSPSLKRVSSKIETGDVRGCWKVVRRLSSIRGGLIEVWEGCCIRCFMIRPLTGPMLRQRNPPKCGSCRP